MSDKDYNTLSETSKKNLTEEAQPALNNDSLKKLGNSNENLENYFKDEEENRRTDFYDTIDKFESDNLKKKDENSFLPVRTHSYVGHVDDAPGFSRDNEFILRGYRVNFHTCETIAKSLCLCHNETVNVWTHLVGALFTMVLIVIVGINIGPYSSSVNESWRAEKREIYFEKFSTTFYSSIPLFHNTRIFLSYFNQSLRKLSNNTKFKNHHEIATNTTNYILTKNLLDYSALYENLNTIDENFINCASCIEDFSRNIYTIDGFVDETLKHMEELNKITGGTFKIQEDVIEKTISFKLVIKKIINLLSNKVLNEHYDISDFGRYGYDTDSFYSNIYLVKWPIYVQLVCAIICLLCSSTYHLFLAYSHKVVEILARLDYAGISILIAGSCYPAYYYFYYFYRVIYLSFITGFALIVFLFSLTPRFNKPEKRKLRGWLFLLLGISTAIPILHLALFFDEKIGMIEDPQLKFWYIGGAVYISGCLIYIFRFPERIFPGKFDLIGSSHQIWHIFVLGGIIFHHFASLNTYFDRLNHECPSS